MDPPLTFSPPSSPRSSRDDSASTRSRDPDGTHRTVDSKGSVHGEDLLPTCQDSYETDDGDVLPYTLPYNDGGGGDDDYEEEELFEDEVKTLPHRHSSNVFGGSSTTSGVSKRSASGNVNSSSGDLADPSSPARAFPSMYPQQEDGMAPVSVGGVSGAENDRPSLQPLVSQQQRRRASHALGSASRFSAYGQFVDEDEEENDLENGGGAAAANPKHSPFPSVGMLICLAVFVVAAVAGLAGGLTYYSWDKTRLDPLRPPSSSSSSTPSGEGGGDDATVDGGGDDANPLLPTDESLRELFASALNVMSHELVATKIDDGASPPAGVLATRWMLEDDPMRASGPPRSDEAWIQRFLLVHLYYATTTAANGTTTTTTTTWTSCNPRAEDDRMIPTVPPQGEGEEYEDEDEDACWFASPTELPGGRLRYDGWIPSSRWLTGTDECTWGGVSCGTTVAEDIPVRNAPATGPRPVNYRMLRAAVTSISLVGQNLGGADLAETRLTRLRHLRDLDLSHNSLGGTILGDSFSQLERLRLRRNNLVGILPGRLFGISNTVSKSPSPLVELDVGFNSLTGTLPGDLGVVATRLRRLVISDNGFNGTIPVLGGMPLEVFHAPNNELEGILPFERDYGGPWPTTLREWWTSGNALEGSVPSDLGRFVPGLQDLRLDGNKLTGTIPSSLGSLEELWRLDVRDNDLDGTLPTALGDLVNLQELRVQFNRLDGTVPPALCFLESMSVLEADCVFGGTPSDDAEKVDGDLETFGGGRRRQRRRRDNEVIPSFPTLEEAIASIGGGRPTATATTTTPAPVGAPVAGTEAPTGFPTRSDGTTTEIQCYCCTRCCNPRSGDCLAFSTVEV